MINLTEHNFDNINIDIIKEEMTIEKIYNEYVYRIMLITKNVHVSKNKKIDKLKSKKPLEWEVFSKLYNICLSNDLDYKKFIAFGIKECLPKYKFMKPMYLLKPHLVTVFKENLEIAKQYKSINDNIVNSVEKIINICKDNKFENFKQFIKYVIVNNKLGHFIKCGILSRHLLSLIPNIKCFLKVLDSESKYELEFYVINIYDKLLCDSMNALKKYNNESYIKIIEKINFELNIK